MQVPVEPLVATCTNINLEVIPVGFLGGYARMSGVEVSEYSLSHPLGFPDIFYGNYDLNSEFSYSGNSMVEETNWTMERVKKLVFIMDGCFEHVQIVIEGKGNKKN